MLCIIFCNAYALCLGQTKLSDKLEVIRQELNLSEEHKAVRNWVYRYCTLSCCTVHTSL